MALFVPVIASALGAGIVTALASYAGQIALKVLATLGVGYFAFTGVTELFDSNYSGIMTSINSLPPLAIQLAGALQVGTCLKMIFSAIAIRMTLYGLNEGVIKRMGVR